MKKLLAFLVCMSVVLSCLSGITLVSFAADEPLTIGNVTLEVDVNGRYIIDSPEDFAAVFGSGNADHNTTRQKSYSITKDIDLTTLETAYVPNPSMSHFAGDLHGTDENGAPAQRIINFGDLTLSGNENGSYTGYVGAIAATAGYGVTVSYLTLEGTIKTDSTATAGTGALFGSWVSSSGEISHVINNMDISGTTYVGGLIGCVKGSETDLSIVNCTNNGDITATDRFCGGLIGSSTVKVTISNCSNNGKVSGTTEVGGIAGTIASINGAINYCSNTGDVTGKTGGGTTYAGGIIGYMNPAKVTYCNNSGFISGYQRIGGIAGGFNIAATITLDGSTMGIHNSYNTGKVKDYYRYPAGILGFLWNRSATGTENPIISNVFNKGEIEYTNASYVASIANTYPQDTDAANVTIYVSGAYDTFGTVNMIKPKATTDALQLTSCYVLSATNITYGEEVSEAELKALTSSDDAIFSNETIWVTDPSKGNEYPQLVGNLGPVSNAPYNLSLSKENGQWILTWDCALENASYEVFVNDDSQGTIKEKSKVITVASGASSVSVFVVANGKEQSETITVSTEFEGGSGVEGDPYKIATLEQLMKVDKYPSAHFLQIEDIVDTPVTQMLSTTTANRFTGTYDGGGKTIKLNLNVDSSKSYAGLFFQAGNNSVFKNIKLTGTVTSEAINGTAALMGRSGAPSTIENCETSVNVTGAGKKVAGFVGWFEGDNNADTVDILNCKNIGTIINNGTSGAESVAGLVGYANKAIIRDCVNEGSVTSNYASTADSNVNAYAGGIVGQIANGKIINCHNSADIKAAGHRGIYVGGLVAYLQYSEMDSCSNSGSVSGYAGVGGLVGRGYYSVSGNNDVKDAIKNSYNAGKVTGSSWTAGIIGRMYHGGEFETAVTLSNNFNAGIVDSESTGKGSLIGYIDTAKNISGSIEFKGFYSTYNLDILGSGTIKPASGATLSFATSDLYVLGSGSYGLASSNISVTGVTAEELSALTSKTGSVFADSNIWVKSTNGWDYPQLAGNIYYVAIDAKPYGLELDYNNGVYTLTWSGKGDVANYVVCINGDEYGTTTEKSYDVTGAVANSIVSAYVVAVTDDGNKQSETIELNGYFAGGTGSASDPYKVASAEHFMNIEIEQFNGKCFEQVADEIILTDYIFKNIGVNNKNDYKGFVGTYDGKGKTIDLTVTVNEPRNGIGLFGGVGRGAHIKNLTLTGEITVNVEQINIKNVIQYYGVGGFVGNALAGLGQDNPNEFINLTNRATITSVDDYVGGILGNGYTNDQWIENCKNYGTITSKSQYAAGIVASTNTRTSVINCANYGDIIAKTRSGGIVAHSYINTASFGKFKVNGCYNVGTITATGGDGKAAGIIAYSTGRLQYKDNEYSEYTGILNICAIENCYNAGQINGSATAGIVGFANWNDEANAYKNGFAYISNCYNAVTTRYPIAAYTDEIVSEYLTGIGETAAANLTAPMTGEPVNCYYISADPSNDDDSLNGTTPVTKDQLKALELTGFEKSGDYAYPQLTGDNKIPADKDNIDFVKVTLSNNAENESGLVFKGIDASAAYFVAGADVAYVVTPSEDYQVKVTVGEALLPEVVVEKKELLTSAVDGLVISIIDEDLVVTLPEVIETIEDIYQPQAGESIQIGENEYSRFAVTAGRAEKILGAKLVEFGILIADETFAGEEIEYVKSNVSDGIRIAKADAGKISEQGWYGVLINGNNNMKSGTYKVRPYAIYEVKGEPTAVYGPVQEFVME